VLSSRHADHVTGHEGRHGVTSRRHARHGRRFRALEFAAMSTWTDEETRKLVDLWPVASAAQIAKRLQRPRWSVCAKAQRLRRDGVLPPGGEKCFEQNPWPVRAKPEAIAARKPAAPLLHDAANLAMQPLAMRPRSILELDKTRCRWPLGNIHAVAVEYCGGATLPGKRYCPHHLWLAARH